MAGIGEGAASSFNAPGTLQRRAASAASKDVDLSLGVFPCPQCGHRSAGGVARWWMAYGLPLVLTLLGLVGIGLLPYVIDVGMKDDDRPIVAWIMVGVAVVTGLPFFLTTWMKWKGAPRRVRFIGR